MRAFVAALTVLVLALPAWAEVKIQEVTSPQGHNAWLVEDHSIPFTALEIWFRGGTSLDAPSKRGATYLMTGLIEEGAGDLDARAYARRLEELAASFGFDVSDDTLTISTQFLTENRDQVIDLLRTTLHAPRFDPDAINRVRAQVLSGLRSDQTDPHRIAGASMSEAVYGEHPYATEGKGTIDSVSALTRDDIVTAFRGAIARDRVYVGAVGDISAEELSVLLDQLLSDLPEKGVPIPNRAQVTIPGPVRVVDFDTPQSVALFVQQGIDRSDPDFFTAYILNHIIGGGGFESRLMQEVREKRGLTYGVYSYLLPRELASVYMGSVASANDKIAEAVSVIRDVWRDVAVNGVTAKELEDAKTYLTGAYPLRFDGNGRIANILAGMQIQGLPIDYIATRNDQVNAVTLEEINAFAAGFLDPEGLSFTVVGKPVGLEGTN
ncbi:insulinase family protein [Ruegeria pomeroyi]|uniref:Insulinase family protein n=1 Tax=Ruegeria alba TaxID=2916756 RepID=A0ABS9NUV0_9RHOB|nr:pitrilysin family protein [Ruegeria alba]MCE8525316.1 insulinase family protein [Ruegeria pomeroyi]MCE8529348.1 insulinase family protein [Ruegeria pomeroyi]MCE8547659.1 insulinase family protein [Ruegeria pomeroyi]MCG6557992.1 insulinase family protein [Ruegeria alba]